MKDPIYINVELCTQTPEQCKVARLEKKLEQAYAELDALRAERDMAVNMLDRLDADRLLQEGSL